MNDSYAACVAWPARVSGAPVVAGIVKRERGCIDVDVLMVRGVDKALWVLCGRCGH